MTTHPAALHKQVATEIQSRGTVSNAILRVTLLATSLRVLFLEHGPEPKTVLLMAFDLARRCTPVAPVKTRTAKLLRIVNPQDLSIRMADERARQCVRFAARFVRRDRKSVV